VIESDAVQASKEKKPPVGRRPAPPGFVLLHFLTPAQVRLIDRSLKRAGPFGEVRLVKVKGRLRFVQTLESNAVVMEATGSR